MKIWQLNFELDEYDNLIPIRDFTVEEIQSFDGRSHLSQWKPIQVKRMEPEKGLELSDAPGFTFPVFSRNALECLKPLISKNVEILPIDFNEKEYSQHYFGLPADRIFGCWYGRLRKHQSSRRDRRRGSDLRNARRKRDRRQRSTCHG